SAVRSSAPSAASSPPVLIASHSFSSPSAAGASTGGVIIARLMRFSFENPPPPREGDHPQGGGGARAGFPEAGEAARPRTCPSTIRFAAGPPPRAGEDYPSTFTSLIASLSSTCPPTRLVA